MYNSKYKRFLNRLWFFMALYLLNISVDYQGVQNHYNVKSTTFNEQESIIELVVEKGFGFENAISDNETDNSEQNNKLKKSISLDKFVLSNAFLLKNNFLLFTKKTKYYHNYNLYDSCLAIDSPPPKFSFI